MLVGYHSHAGDFKKFDGKTSWEIFFDNTNPEVVHQLDTGNCLEGGGDLERARVKLFRKRLDLIVYNPPKTMDSPDVEAVLLFADGRTETPGSMSKRHFADILLHRAAGLWSPG